jgi:UDP-2-acetamido-2,6-beta-L-arabino-hexul-4-ose reductase
MLKVGITGQNGFIGKHLYNTLGLFSREFERVDFQKGYFEDSQKLNDFVEQCDVIVHLAAKNRHNDPQVIYDTNIGLVQKLITSLERTKSEAHLLFSSSTQEERDNLYGKSKREGRELMVGWSERSGGKFTGMVIPNVFGPFGHPNYNSVIATFCFQLSHNERPVIDVDGTMKLIYVGELVEEILKQIRSAQSNYEVMVPSTSESKVSEILALLEDYKMQYQEKGIIPTLNNRFEVNLFNTFRSYMDIENYFPVKFTRHTDPRGAFVEVIRLNVGGQVSFSTTVPGITRGNHFHTRKIERFAVIKGNALIQLRQIGTDKVLNYELDGKEPAYVDMPVWYTHNIKNTGKEELYTIFWINEFYDAEDSDTYFETV